jgi:galactokinase
MEEARRGFAAVFGGEPSGVWAAPGRVNVIGEHTDYNDGFVLPMAIDRACYASASPRADRVLRVHAAQLGATVEVSLDGLAPGAAGAAGDWAAYPVGVAWVLAEAGYPVSGADVYLTSTVPVGAGLSSSAALECASALALAGVSGFELSKPDLAKLAQRAENDYVGVPCGPLDQMSSVFGEDGSVLFIDTRSGEVRPRPFDLAAADAILVVVDTRVSHAHGENGYADRRAACEAAAAFLGVPALRDVPFADLDAAFGKVTVGLGEATARRLRHVVAEDARVEEFVGLLDGAGAGAGAGSGASAALPLAELGRLMTASHASLRDDFEVSAPELDVVVSAALAHGAHGARMTGGGFGGSAIALVDVADLAAVQDAVRAAFAEHGFTEPAFFPAVASAGARRVDGTAPATPAGSEQEQAV